MPTRAAAAREAAFLASVTKPSKQQLSIPSVTPQVGKQAGNARRGKVVPKLAKKGLDEKLENDEVSEDSVSAVGGPSVEPASATPEPSNKKRKRAAPKPKNQNLINGELVKGGWDELPHNMGKAVGSEDPENRTGDLLSKERVPTTKTPPKPRVSHGKAKKAQQETPETSDQVEDDPIAQELKEEFKEEFLDEISEAPPTKKPARKRARGPATRVKDEAEIDDKPKKKLASRSKKIDQSKGVQDKVNDIIAATETPKKKAKKGKANPYGLSPGETPFPDFTMPTLEACSKVHDLLSQLHGSVTAPKEIPAPSLSVTGCGEVPSVLDALIRTRLSAATTNKNAGYAFQGLVKKYGLYEDGIGKGSCNWNKVLDSEESDIAKAIQRGGLAAVKAKSIKAILGMVQDLNIQRRDAFVQEKEDGEIAKVVGAENMTQGQKDMEIKVGDDGILSLQFFHGLNSDEAMTELVKFPGIGVKTASCVILFCLQRPSFAVDTHVWRLCKWLKWVPENATRDQTFSHCEVRVPDELKYPLHQLFIKHGKTCGRCRAITGETSETWQDANCPIEELVTRTGSRKGGEHKLGPKSSPYGPPKRLAEKAAKIGGKAKPKTPKKGKRGKKTDEWDSDAEEEELELDETPEPDEAPEVEDDDEEVTASSPDIEEESEE